LINNLPSGWSSSQLSDKRFIIKYGKANPKKSGKIPVIGSSGIFSHTDQPLVNPPVIIIGRKGNAGSVQFIKEPCWASDTTFYIKILSEDVDYFYLYYLLEKNKRSRTSTQTTLPSLSLTDFYKEKLNIPPLVEQRGIAEVLGTVDEAIRRTDAVIEKAEELKRGLMQRLLTRGIGHTEFKQTELGEIPKTWEVKKIQDIYDKPQYGYTASANEKPIGPKFLRITDIQDGEVNWKNVPYCDSKNDDVSAYYLRKNDLVFTRTGATTGKSYLITTNPDAIFASYLIRIKSNSGTDPVYLSSFFNSEIYWKQINQKRVGSAQGGVNASTLSSIKLPLPPFNEQIRISSIINEVENKIKIEKLEKKQLEEIKRGVIQILLSGKVRVELREDGLHRIGDG